MVKGKEYWTFLIFKEADIGSQGELMNFFLQEVFEIKKDAM